MSTALAVCHGRFGRAALYSLNRPMATHAHREGHLIFHVDGPPAVVHVSGRPMPLFGRAAVAVNPWEPHDFRPGSSRECSVFLILYISPAWFHEAARGRAASLSFGRAGLDASGSFAASIADLATLLSGFGPIEALGGRLQELTLACFEASWLGADGPRPAAPRASDFRVRKSIRLLSERLGEEIALDEVAREAGLSRPHFYKLFRRETGLTPNLFLNTLRMERATLGLAASARSVTEIAYDLGFSSQSCFTRFFAANVGMPPSDYRRVARLLNA